MENVDKLLSIENDGAEAPKEMVLWLTTIPPFALH
jgi:hypothetical protein